MHANITNALRYRIYRRDGFRCALCDSTSGLQIHHVLPRGRGGNGSEYNLITLCRFCHAIAHGRPLDPTEFTADDINEAAYEYLADYYAEDETFRDVWASIFLGEDLIGLPPEDPP